MLQLQVGSCIKHKSCAVLAWHERKRLALRALVLALLALIFYVVWLCWRCIYVVAQTTIQRDSHFLRASFFLLIGSPVAHKFSCAPELAFMQVFFVR
jgi:hypothetical protein